MDAGTSFGGELPPYDEFRMGGLSSFLGLAPGQLRGHYLGIASLGYRYRITRLPPSLGDGVYAITRCDVGNVWEDSDDIATDDLLIGGGAGVAVDTIPGPMYVAYGRAEGGFDRIYFTIGARF